jgi:hypothetical protein
MHAEMTQLIASLGFFKDWTNYLLVTTVAALGWIATKPLILDGIALKWTIGFLSLSIVFAILTLALVPLVGERLTAGTSLYDVKAKFTVLWLWGPEGEAKLKWVCWPQHVFFLAGIITFSVGSILRISAAKQRVIPR